MQRSINRYLLPSDSKPAAARRDRMEQTEERPQFITCDMVFTLYNRLYNI